MMELLRKIHEDENGIDQPGDDPDHRRDRLADLDLPAGQGWPTIKSYFNQRPGRPAERRVTHAESQ